MKRFVIALAIVIAFANSVSADTPAPGLPALYDVVDVAADDQLNIRSAPDAGSEIIGKIAHDQKRIEVTAFSMSGRWARINAVESTGWVAMRYLRPHAVVPTAADLICFGTEPFWTIRFGDDRTLTIATPDDEDTYPISRSPKFPAIGGADFTGLRFDWQSDDDTVTSHILPGQCSDGMSDRLFGLHYIDTKGPHQGCCRLQ